MCVCYKKSQTVSRVTTDSISATIVRVKFRCVKFSFFFSSRSARVGSATVYVQPLFLKFIHI